MPDLTMLLIDLAAIILLTVVVYFRRHRRRDLVVAFTAVNIGVFAVATVLASAEVAVGLGLGLFGVLSIIRLRSSEITQREVAYYFAALAIGLICGLTTGLQVLPIMLVALLVIAMTVIDHPGVFASWRHQTVQLDQAIADEAELRRLLSERLAGEVHTASVQHIDFVNDTMLVDVRYRSGRGTHARPAGERLGQEAHA